MVDALNVLLSGLLIYIFFMMFFIPLFKIGLFECYMLITKKSPQEIVNFVEQAYLPPFKENMIRLFFIRSDKSEKYLETYFGSLSFIQGLFDILFANFFLTICIWVFIKMSIQASQTEGAASTVIAIMWLAYSIWCYGNALLFLKLLKTEDRRLRKSENES